MSGKSSRCLTCLLPPLILLLGIQSQTSSKSGLVEGDHKMRACSHLQGAPTIHSKAKAPAGTCPAPPMPLGPHCLPCSLVSLLRPHRLPSKLRGTSGHGTFTLAAPSALPRAHEAAPSLPPALCPNVVSLASPSLPTYIFYLPNISFLLPDLHCLLTPCCCLF